MGKLIFPERYNSTLARLMKMDDPQFGEITAALKRLNPSRSPDRLQEEFVENFKAIPESDSRQLFEIIMSLYFLKDSHPLDGVKLVPDVLESTSDSDEFEDSSDEDRSRLAKRLEELLTVPQLEITAHAVSVASDHDCSFVKCRFLTDVRGVFMDEECNQPAGAVIAHTLKLTYLQNGEQKDFYLSMDGDDLQQLEKSVARARKKQLSFNSILEKAALPNLQE